MTPFNLTLTITKGITYGPATFAFKESDGSPFDLSDGGTWKVFAYARTSEDQPRKIDLVPTITDAAGGEIQITKTDEETLALMAGEYGWDMILENPSGVRIGPYFAGKLKVREIFTHA